jgi:hypothetical protein
VKPSLPSPKVKGGKEAFPLDTISGICYITNQEALTSPLVGGGSWPREYETPILLGKEWGFFMASPFY